VKTFWGGASIWGHFRVLPPRIREVGLSWKTIDWPSLRQEVRRLQMRIAKATQAGKHRKVQALQWLLTHSRSAKLLAVYRVTTNRGAKTPGVDNVLWRTDRQKLQAAFSLKRHGYRPRPLRRHYIPKPNGKSERVPSGAQRVLRPDLA